MLNRAAFERELLFFIDQFIPGSQNRAIYEERLKKTTDAELEVWVQNLAEGKEIIALFAPNLTEFKIDTERNQKICKALGYDLFQHLYLTDPQTGVVYKTNAKHMTGLVPFRRQVQMLYKKMSIPEGDDVVDERSGQATGVSKGARLSYPEIQVNAAKGLDNMVLELIKYRGGDEKAYNAMNRSIYATGEASLEEISARGPTSVKAAQTLSVFLKTMHLGNNL